MTRVVLTTFLLVYLVATLHSVDADVFTYEIVPTQFGEAAISGDITVQTAAEGFLITDYEIHVEHPQRSTTFFSSFGGNLNTFGLLPTPTELLLTVDDNPNVFISRRFSIEQQAFGPSCTDCVDVLVWENNLTQNGSRTEGEFLYFDRVDSDPFLQSGEILAIPQQAWVIGTRMVPVVACDFSGDGLCDVTDLDLMQALGPIAPGIPATGNEEFDLIGDGTIDLLDRDEWLAQAATENGFGSPYKLGDANLDGVVDGQDFIAWNGAKFTSDLLWSSGDWNADGVVDGQDFILWNGNKFTSSDVVSVPEPNAGFLLIVALGLTFRGRRFGF